MARASLTHRRLDRVLPAIIEAGLIALLVFTPAAFGSTHEISCTVMEVGLLALGILWMVRKLASGLRTPVAAMQRRGWLGLWLRPSTYVCAFVVLAAVQLVPLPRAVVGLLSPNRVVLDEAFRVPQSSAPPWRGAPHSPAPAPSLTLSVYPHATLGALFRVIAYGAAFLIVTGCLRAEAPTRRILYAIVLIGASMAALGIYQHRHWGTRIYRFWQSRYTRIPFGPYVNRNHFACYMAMVGPLAFSVFVGQAFSRRRRSSGRRQRVERPAGAGADRYRRESERGWPASWAQSRRLLIAVVGLCSACIIVAALFASLSRGGVMAFAVASAVFLALSALRKWRLKRALAVIAALVLIWGIGLHYGGQRLRKRFDQVDWGRGARPHLWRGALRMYQDFPVFGVGLGCFQHVFPRYKPITLGDQFYRAAHCDPLQAFVEMGALGIIAIVAMLGCIVVPALRQIRGSRSHAGSWLLVGELSAISAMLAHSLVDFNFHIPANALLFVVILGLTYNTARGLRLTQQHADARAVARDYAP